MEQKKRNKKGNLPHTLKQLLQKKKNLPRTLEQLLHSHLLPHLCFAVSTEKKQKGGSVVPEKIFASNVRTFPYFASLGGVQGLCTWKTSPALTVCSKLNVTRDSLLCFSIVPYSSVSPETVIAPKSRPSNLIQSSTGWKPTNRAEKELLLRSVRPSHHLLINWSALDTAGKESGGKQKSSDCFILLPH